MAKTAVREAFNPNFTFGGRSHAETMPKRKTPSELRGEQLKRRSFEEMPADTKMVSDSVKKSEPSRNPKYIDTRLNEHFPVRKYGITCPGIKGTDKPKVSLDLGKTADVILVSPLPKPYAACNVSKENRDPSINNGNSEAQENLSHCLKSSSDLGFQKIEKCSQNTFRSVAHLSIGKEVSSDSTRIDMDKALKGLVARNSLCFSDDSSKIPGSHSSKFTRKSQSEYHIFGQKIPLDFTLKNTIRLVSSSSVKWLHNLASSGLYNDVGKLGNPSNGTEQSSCLKDDLTASDRLIGKALNSWKYPQSLLPSSIVSVMSLSSSSAEADFLKKRRQDWEDSFHNLYYMLRQKKCAAFYVFTSQFITLFVSGFSTRKRNGCNAYISQSTNGLRSLLAENDIYFSMPLCRSNVEQATTDDLVELSEIEKCNLGQAEHSDLSMDLDNSPQSLLSFHGNESVHNLFDFLLNYRFLLTSLSSCDVPVLYSPVPFKNASVYSPEIRCKEMRRANFRSSGGSEADEMESFYDVAATSVCYSVEIKDDILPPWVISGICAAMASRSSEFEASFVLDPKSAGLNIALDSLRQTPEMKNAGSDCTSPVGITETINVPWLHSAYLRSLKHSEGSYTGCIEQL